MFNGTDKAKSSPARPRTFLMVSRPTIQGTSLQRIIEALFSLHLAIGIGIVASARFAWLYSHAEKDTPRPALALLLYELPFVFCLLPFVTGETSKRTARSAGMVFGTALGFCPLLLLLTVGAVFTFGGAPPELARFLPRCFIVAVWMLGVSWRYGKDDRREFIASVKRGILCFFLVSLLVLLASL